MNIALWGYGKMGKTIHALLEQSEHEVVGIIHADTRTDRKQAILEEADGVIEFTQPDAALGNVLEALEAGVAVVSGTTAWTQHLSKVEETVERLSGKFMIGSNFSIGVNIMFKLTQELAKLTSKFGGYTYSMEEIHHTQKLDSPSGTAVSLADLLIQNSDYSNWKEVAESEPTDSNVIPIVAKRQPDVPGTHNIEFHTEVDTLQFGHIAHSREGFAKGAITALEWLMAQESGSYDVKQMFEN